MAEADETLGVHHPTVGEVVEALDRLYPPAAAADWDAVGLVCGDPDATVAKVLFAVDPTLAVLDEARDWGADLLVTHHPLLLRGVHGVAATNAKGRIVHGLVRAGIALYVAHTNADVAAPGVSDALARVIGLEDLQPLVADPPESATGIGRVGTLPAPISLFDLAQVVAEALPSTVQGVRAAGPEVAMVQRIAVCGGAGDDLFDAVRASGADAYVTADLRHHPALEAREDADGPPYLVDVAHWASEWPWLAGCANRLSAVFDVVDLGETAGQAGQTTVETRVSTARTDPWTIHVPSRGGMA